MAFVTSPQISNLAVELLARSVVLAGTVSSVDPSEFSGDNGDEVIIRVPQTGTHHTQTPGTPITFDAIVETPVTLSVAHIYNATQITDQALSLEIADFGRQVTAIQVEAVTHGVEATVAAAMNAIAADSTTGTSAAVDADVLAAHTALTQNNVPMSGRYLAVDPLYAQALLASDLLKRADQSGSTGALRDATIGTYRGFTVVVSNDLSAGTAGAGRAVAYHRSGFAMTVKRPLDPRGAGSSSTASSQGLTLRHIFQYEGNQLRDQSVVSVFTGAVLVDADRVYVTELAS